MGNGDGKLNNMFISDQELKQKIKVAPEKKVEEKTLLSKIGSVLKERTKGAIEAGERFQTGKQTFAETALQVGGEIAGGAAETFGATFGEGVKKISSGIEAVAPETTQAVKEGAKSAGAYILQTSAGRAGIDALTKGAESYDKWKTANPRIAEDLEAVVNIASILPSVKGAQIAGEVAASAADVAKLAGSKALGVAEKVVDVTKPVVQGGVDIAKIAGKEVAQIPSKVGTNIATKQAAEATIKKLPTKVAQETARMGIDTKDVEDIYKIPQKVKPEARKLANSIVNFAKGATDVDPIESVGKPIVAKIKQFEKAKGTIGQKLGEVANTLPNVTQKELVEPIFNSLKSVNGLSGLKMNKAGVLDFTDTVLATADTASDRNAIQSIFIDAIKSGSGKQKHLLRQELFEILGGKKKAGIQLTETQDKAYQAIRKGLSDVLETKNDNYKSLSNQYRKVTQPLQELRKMMGTLPGAEEDIMDMSAGLLARRLTSTSISQGKVRTILDAMDSATKEKGNLRETTEQMQKLYNIMGKYYDIAPKTGFQGQVRAGIEGAGGITDVLVGAAKSVAGETTVVRQKAIEKALKEALLQL